MRISDWSSGVCSSDLIHADFSSEAKLEIARALAEFGIGYLEVTSPAASRRSREDARAIASAGLPVTVAAHIRCHQDDAAIAIDTGVDALPMVRSEEHTSELQSLMRISYAVFCMKKKKNK